MTLEASIQSKVDQWLNGQYDPETKEMIRRIIIEDPEEIINAFYTNLSFGTGGLRAIMGVGPNRINTYTIMTATQGLANYINQQPTSFHKHSVFIGYDSRNRSQEFAEAAAKVLAANGIHVYLCNELRPTPLVSFGCRLKHCTAAIVITASHNPPEYNGYKVYWSDGGQIISPHDDLIIKECNKITKIEEITYVNALNHPLIEKVSTEIDDAYIQAIGRLQHYEKENKQHGSKLKIIYSSLHGTGITLMPKALSAWGFNQVILVKDQSIPDGNFPSLSSPNPEEESALKLGIDTLKAFEGDILIATDPDADRLGVAVKHENHVHLINGNQIACLCLHHICKALIATNTLPEKAAFIKTIGTSELFQSIADHYKRPCFNVLTGFKYIAGKIHEWEKQTDGYQFIFGGEESFGYLLGTDTRDKDAILSGALICEVALQAKLKKNTLIDLLHEIYHIHGVYHEELLSIQFEDSKCGKEQLKEKMTHLQTSPPKMIGEVQVVILEDYQRSIRTNLLTNEITLLTLPKSDVLLFWLEDGTKIMVRPSGTEPKVKLYIGVVNKQNKNIPEALSECQIRAKSLLLAIKTKMLNKEK